MLFEVPFFFFVVISNVKLLGLLILDLLVEGNLYVFAFLQ
jgi:hypothetical protein